MSVTNFPRRTGGLTVLEQARTSVKDLGDLLDAISDGVLVVADDIPEEQRQEIFRELALMRLINDVAREGTGLPKVTRSVHLQRESQS